VSIYFLPGIDQGLCVCRHTTWQRIHHLLIKKIFFAPPEGTLQLTYSYDFKQKQRKPEALLVGLKKNITTKLARARGDQKHEKRAHF
jgi:hypothetical protein